MKKILVIDDDKIVQKILQEFSEEVCIFKDNKLEEYKPKTVVLNYNGITLNPESYEVFIYGLKIPLTIREFQILKLLMEHPNKVFSRQNILDSVWGYEYYGNSKIVNEHIKKIRKKIGIDCIETVRGIGYKLKE